MMQYLVVGLALAIAVTPAACGADNSTTSGPPPTRLTATSPRETGSMKIRITVEDKVMTATLLDNKTAQDFVSLLPLTLSMNDLFGREKYGHLPRALSDEGKRTRTYEVGDIVYWSPGPDVAIYYRHDGQAIPAPGIIVIGKIDSRVEALDVPGSLRVTVELVGRP
jgi:hypothetical protein